MPPLRAIRNKVTGKIKAAAYTVPGGLGDFDPTLYEEIELDSFPTESEQEPSQADINAQILMGRTQLRHLIASAPLELQAMFDDIFSRVFVALELDLFDLAIRRAEWADVSEEAIPDTALRGIASTLKTQIVTGLEQIKNLAGSGGI